VVQDLGCREEMPLVGGIKCTSHDAKTLHSPLVNPKRDRKKRIATLTTGSSANQREAEAEMERGDQNRRRRSGRRARDLQAPKNQASKAKSFLGRLERPPEPCVGRNSAGSILCPKRLHHATPEGHKTLKTWAAPKIQPRQPIPPLGAGFRILFRLRPPQGPTSGGGKYSAATRRGPSRLRDQVLPFLASMSCGKS
jgi:hypothetical protein